jgi:hypothetical protein
VAVLRAAVPAGPGRLLSEIIAVAEIRGSSVLLDGSFARGLEEVIHGHQESLNPPAWDERSLPEIQSFMDVLKCTYFFGKPSLRC